MTTSAPALLALLVPKVVAVCEVFGDAPDASMLPAEEEAAISSAVPRRRNEFAAGRNSARQALARLGYPPLSIPRGSRGEPQWPSGVVGSITHCRGYVAAAVARAQDCQTIGIDAEPNRPLPAGVLDMVAVDSERQWLIQNSDYSTVCWDRLLFSIKESVYKAWFPLMGTWLGFSDAQITVHPEAGRFQVQLVTRSAQDLPEFTGNFLANQDLLVTAIAVTS